MKLSYQHLLCPILCLAALCVVPYSHAQAIAASTAGQIPARATVAGVVTKDPGAEPVKKALIELIAENQSTGGDYTAITAADGTFRIEDIVPGRYLLMAERTGFIQTEGRQPRSEGRLLTLAAGRELKDVFIRLQATAAIDGHVTDEDGDPLADAQVAVLRQSFTAGHSRWEQVGAQRTNDLGEYRVAGLAAGHYYISVTPPPDFKSLIEAASNAPTTDAAEPGRQDCSIREGANCSPGKLGITSYMTTYYPGVKDRAQAALVQLRAGEDFPANFSLTPSPSVAIRGSIGPIPAGASAAVMLRTFDSNSILNGGEVRKDGTFEIRDVSPGAYTLLSTVTGTAPSVLMARQTVEVGAEDVTGLHLVPQPGSEIRGRLRLESKDPAKKIDPGQFFVVLHSADGDDDGLASTLSVDDISSNVAQVAIDGGFVWKNVSAARYFVALSGDGGTSPEWFIKSVMSGGRDVSDSGLNVSGGTIAVEVVASANGAALDGIVIDPKGSPISNATAVLIPEGRFRSRIDFFRKTETDQSGRFLLQGIRPGIYTILAWESLDGEDYSNPEFLKRVEGQGRTLHLGESEHTSLQIEVVASPEDQP